MQSVWTGVLISANHLMENNHDLSTTAESTVSVYITWQWPPLEEKMIFFLQVFQYNFLSLRMMNFLSLHELQRAVKNLTICIMEFA